MAAPEVARVASMMAGKALVLKIDTEAHPDIAGRFGVRSIPNFVILKNGRSVFQQAGVASAADMAKWLESAGAS
jgi:thioredoxin 2